MNEFFKKIKIAVNKLMPYALILLFILIVLELTLHTKNHTIEFLFKFLDTLVIELFIVDLIYSYIGSKDIRFFFKNYWLDIIAVLPFGLIFKFAESFFLIGIEAERMLIGQKVLHEVTQSEKMLKFVSELSKEVRLLRFIPRTIDWIKTSNLYSKLHDYFFYNKTKYEPVGKYNYKH